MLLFDSHVTISIDLTVEEEELYAYGISLTTSLLPLPPKTPTYATHASSRPHHTPPPLALPAPGPHHTPPPLALPAPGTPCTPRRGGGGAASMSFLETISLCGQYWLHGLSVAQPTRRGVAPCSTPLATIFSATTLTAYRAPGLSVLQLQCAGKALTRPCSKPASEPYMCLFTAVTSDRV